MAAPRSAEAAWEMDCGMRWLAPLSVAKTAQKSAARQGLPAESVQKSELVPAAARIVPTPLDRLRGDKARRCRVRDRSEDGRGGRRVLQNRWSREEARVASRKNYSIIICRRLAM